ncbi:MAG: endopeptidase La [Candidatus Shikimatogenerans sp. JK-2022]|nr:endopeptidase La [Candidatus Shikimatogenerans bostrichidophilus]
MFNNQKKKEKKNKKKKIYFLTLENYIIFPNLFLAINFYDFEEINFLKKQKKIGIITKIKKKIFKIGVICKIQKIINNNNFITVFFKGYKKFLIKSYKKKKQNIFKSKILIIEEKKEIKKYKKKIYLEKIKKFFLKLNFKNFLFDLNKFKNFLTLIYYITSNLNINIKKKQKILKIKKIEKKIQKLLKILQIEINKKKFKEEIEKKILNKVNKQQKKIFLIEQKKIIEKELGYKKKKSVFLKFLKKYKRKKKIIPKEAKKKIKEELYKFKFLNNQIPEYNILNNYLDFILNLPWKKYTKDNLNFNRANFFFKKKYYGLELIKNRIIEFLSILKNKKQKKTPILCFVGPPGVGKTSLGKIIAKILSRKYVKFSLGGLHNESEIRGHRKTYIGAMPGRILQLIKKIGTSNPVFLLDEIDKINSKNNYYGDPNFAMLEVLDKEQNKNFYDNYLEVNYDLSKIFFICTANTIDDLHPALLDRLEVIKINGYNLEEKKEIVKRFLIPKIKKNYNLKEKIKIKNKIIKKIILNYTYEAGIRDLEKKLEKIFRYIVKKKVINNKKINKIDIKLIKKLLGTGLDIKVIEKIEYPGQSIGLAWNGNGGTIIYIESNLTKGYGKINLTGNIGKVFEESVLVVLRHLKFNYKKYKIKYKYFKEYDLNINLPEIAVPKEGPSAGLAIFLSLFSLYTKILIKSNLAVTGEVSLFGKILPVGGIDEKVLSAKRSNIKIIILPKQNKNDLREIKKKYLKGLKFYFVKEVKDLKKIAFKK